MELDRELPSSSSAALSSSSSSSSSSLKQKLCSSICFSCFFNVHGSGGGGGDDDCEDRPIALARLLPELGEAAHARVPQKQLLLHPPRVHRPSPPHPLLEPFRYLRSLRLLPVLGKIEHDDERRPRHFEADEELLDGGVGEEGLAAEGAERDGARGEAAEPLGPARLELVVALRGLVGDDGPHEEHRLAVLRLQKT